LGASSATAATDVGNACTANTEIDQALFFNTASDPSNPLPVVVPSDGVVTEWKVILERTAGTFPEQLKVVRPTGQPNAYEVVGESNVKTVKAGLNEFPTKVPVEKGDLIGVYGTNATLLCGTGNTAQDMVGLFLGDVPVGQTFDAMAANTVQAAIVATVEPDADEDGFGDETRDGCPESPKTKAECPKLKVDSVAVAGQRSLRVHVTSSAAAQVKVSATAKLAGGRVQLRASSKDASAGKLTRHSLRYPPALRRAAAALDHGERIKLTARVAARDKTGTEAADVVRAALAG
jgi:hypothetical protein